jgi:tetratricopeptide (TPR) repeat protein
LSEIPSDYAQALELAQAARRRGDRSGALESFRAASEHQPENAWIKHEIATELGALGCFEEAEASYRAALALDPRSIHSWRARALLARQRGDRAQALAYFQAAEKLDTGENPWAAHDVATELRELGRFGDAAEAYRNIAAQFPAFIPARVDLARLLRQSGDRAEALGQFRAVMALEPDSPWAAHEVVTELRELRQFEEAEAIYRGLVEKDAAFLPALRGLARLARRRGHRAEALRHFRAVAEIVPDDPWATHDVATELRELGLREQEEALFKTYVESHPNSAQGLIFYAECTRSRMRARETTALFEAAVAVEPDSLTAKLALASEYGRLWRLDDADALCDAALGLEPDNPWVLIEKGRIARRRGQRQDALGFFESAASAPAAPETAIVEWSTELLETGRGGEARQLVLELISRSQNRPGLHMHLGALARMTGDHAAARAAFARAAELGADGDQARIELAYQEFQQGRAVEAIELLKAVLKDHPGRPRALEALALIVQQLDDIEGAVALWRKALESDPSNPWSLTQLAQALARLGHLREADEILAAFEDRTGALPAIEAVRARICTEGGDLAGAREIMRKACAKFPEHFDLWHQRVFALIQCGAFEQARRALEAPPAGGAREGARVSLLRGHLAAALWDLEAAQRHFADGLRFNGSDPWTNDCAARIALMRVDVDAAQKYLETSVRHDPVHRARHAGHYKVSQTHLGQFIDEFRLDQAALNDVRDRLAAADPVKALAQLVMTIPDYTPAALNFMIALRKKGLLLRPPSKAAPLHRAIPARIAQFWDENIPPDVEALCEEWRNVHPEFSYRRFSKIEARRFLAGHGPSGALEAFDRAAEPTMKADIFRLAWLHGEGGFYIDADDRCLARLDSVDPGECSLLLYQEDFGTIGNNFMGAIARHPAIEQALLSAIEAVNRGDSDVVWLSTGPGLLTRGVARFLAEDMAGRLRATAILDRHELARAVAIHCVTSYRHTTRHWSRSSFKSGAPRLPAWSRALRADGEKTI